MKFAGVAWVLAVAAVGVALAVDVDIVTTEEAPSCTRPAADGDQVHVHYEGFLMDGTKFDSSYDREDPLSFDLGSGMVIKGWETGIKGMCKGEKRELTIPHELAYGEAGMPPTIPAKATLKFNVELMGIGDSFSGAEGDYDDYDEAEYEGHDGEDYEGEDFDGEDFDGEDFDGEDFDGEDFDGEDYEDFDFDENDEDL